MRGLLESADPRSFSQERINVKATFSILLSLSLSLFLVSLRDHRRIQAAVSFVVWSRPSKSSLKPRTGTRKNPMKDSWSINVERFCAKVESLLNLTKRFFAGPLFWPGQFCQLISPAILKSWPENGDSFVHRPVLFKTGTCTINAWTPQDVVLPRETYKYRVFALARPLSYICFLPGIAHVPGGLCKAHFLGDNCTVISRNSSFLCQPEKERRKGVSSWHTRGEEPRFY